jgi:tetratricopeptide (TPR) repeat protein
MKSSNICGPVLFSGVLLLFSACAREETKIPITTDSEEALELYQEATSAMEDVYVAKATDLFNQALEKDPDFFMAAYNLASMNLYFGNEEEFQRYAEKAMASEANLSEGEEIMLSMLEKLMEDADADVMDLGNQLVEMYPEDPVAYSQLAFAQMMANDYEGVVNTYMDALEVAEDSASIYNMMGYAYMELGRMDQARSVFDRYIEMEPGLPNPYDSRGDYYMRIMDYEKAYENYMKAYEIDSAWSFNKAMRAKALQDTLQMQDTLQAE